MLERLAVDAETLRRFACRKVAAVKGVIGFRARQTGRRHDEINPGAGGNGEAIEVIVPAAVKDVGNLQKICPIGRRAEIEQAACPIALEFATGGVGEDEGRVHA